MLIWHNLFCSFFLFYKGGDQQNVTTIISSFKHVIMVSVVNTIKNKNL